MLRPDRDIVEYGYIHSAIAGSLMPDIEWEKHSWFYRGCTGTNNKADTAATDK